MRNKAKGINSSARSIFGRAVVDNSETVNNIVNNYGLDADATRLMLGDVVAELSQKIQSNGDEVTTAVEDQICKVVGNEFVSVVCKLEAAQKNSQQTIMQAVQANFDSFKNSIDNFANEIFGKLQKLQSALEDIELASATLSKSSAKYADNHINDLLSAVNQINAHTTNVVAAAVNKPIQKLLQLLHEDIQKEYIDAQRVISRCNELCKCAVSEDIVNLCKFYITICGDNSRDKNKQLRTLEVQNYPEHIADILRLSIMFLSRDTILNVGGLIERAKGCNLFTTTQHAQWLSFYENEALKHKKDVYTVDKERQVFIAYKSEDIAAVEELCEFLEARGLECFVAARNLQKSVGGNYEVLIKRAIDACKAIVFVSSRASRAYGDAITIEFPYLIQADKTFALQQGEAFTSYETIPNYCKKPRAEFLIEEYASNEIIPYSVEAVFSGRTWIRDCNVLAKYLFDEISNREVAIAAKRSNLNGTQIPITVTKQTPPVEKQPVKKEPVLTAEEMYAKGKDFYDNEDYENAVVWFRKAAEQGNAVAQNNLGNCYYLGKGVEQNYVEAVKWYRQAAEQGDADAQNSLGECYYFGKGVEQNYAEAVKWYRKAAEQGYADAQYNLGYCYYHTEAVRWYRWAAELGNFHPYINTAVYDFNGQDVANNYAEALRLFLKAAEQGHADAQNNLGECYYFGKGVEQNYTEAVKWYRKAAEQGHADAQNNLGDCYYYGNGVKRNYTDAVKLYRKAVKKGLAEAQNSLGACYYFGNGVKRNYTDAVKLYRKAAEQGHADAQNNLGDCYYFGNGVAKSDAESVKWYRKAAEQGHADAQEKLGLSYQFGEGVEKNYSEAVKWHRKAAEQGDAVARYNLGRFYYHGQGVEKNSNEAVKWMRKAAEQGYPDAIKWLKDHDLQ